jgi:hypothetical protein
MNFSAAMFPLFPVFCIASIVLIVLTNKIKNPILYKIAIFLPPLFLLSLIWITQNIITVIHWIAGTIAYFISCLSLLRIFKSGYNFKLIRPILAILCFTISINMVELSMLSADNYAKDLAYKIHNECNKNGYCRSSLGGWEQDSYKDFVIDEKGKYILDEKGNIQYIDRMRYAKFYGEFGTKYRVLYTPSVDYKTFGISVKHNIDEGLFFRGGTKDELTANLSFPGSKADEYGLDNVGKFSFQIPILSNYL